MRAGASLPGPNEKWLSCDSHFLYRVVPRRGLGHTGATPAGPAGPAFLALTRCAQAHRFLGQMKKWLPCDSHFLYRVVPRRGLEPPHLAAHGPEPCASTNSATWAHAAQLGQLKLRVHGNLFNRDAES